MKNPADLVEFIATHADDEAVIAEFGNDVVMEAKKLFPKEPVDPITEKMEEVRELIEVGVIEGTIPEVYERFAKEPDAMIEFTNEQIRVGYEAMVREGLGDRLVD